MRRVPVPNKSQSTANSEGRNMLLSWFPQWIGWYSSPSTEDDINTEAAKLEGEILQALSDTVENNTLLKRDVVFGRFSFTLKNGTLSMCTSYNGAKERLELFQHTFCQCMLLQSGFLY